MKKCFVTVASIILLIIVGVLTTVIIAGKRINIFDNKENKKSFIEITPSSTQKAVDEILPGDTSDLGNSAVMPSDSGDIHPSKEPIQNKGTLMADPIIWDYFGGYPNLGAYPVFGSDHRRHEISAISFLDSLTEAPENAFDVSEEKNGTVIAWFVPDADADGLYKMYIAGNGGVNAPSDCEAMFAGYGSLKKIEFHGFYDTGNVTNMDRMFTECNTLTSLDLSDFDTRNVTNMGGMFSYCSSLTALDLSGFDTGNVTSMYEMFFHCSSLIALDVSSFKTGNVESMHDMFGWCKMLRKLDVSRFDTGNVTGMDRMFQGCYSLTELDVSGFDTGNVISMDAMFYGCSSLTTLDVSGFNTGNVKFMEKMFKDCESITALDVSGFDIRKVEDMEGMFEGCKAKIIGREKIPDT